MAYAVLEERLLILHSYFKDDGDAAVNTLLFSSLLGTPFNSNIVKNVLESISNSEDTELRKIQEIICTDDKTASLSDMHYEIIEEVYEILSRYTSFTSVYEYRHSLLNIFLEKQLEYILKDTTLETKDKLFELILHEIVKEEKQQDFYGEHEQSLKTKEYENMLFFRTIEQNVLRVAYQNRPSVWAEQYTRSLNNLASSLSKKADYQVALIYFEEYFQIIDFTQEDDIKNFIYPVVKWYQCILRLENTEKPLELDVIIKSLISLYKGKLDKSYIDRIKEEEISYKKLSDGSVSTFDKEKYDIFVKLFIKEEI